MSALPLPPGQSGFPILGETLSFIGDMFGFIASRTARHGRIFRSNILGTPTVFISGPDVTDTWLDDMLIQREGSFPKNLQELFGGLSLPLLDGPDHTTRKKLVMSAFGRSALASYVPVLERAVRSSFDRIVSASAAAPDGVVAWLPELKRLAIEGIVEAMLGVPPGEELDAFLADYATLTRGFTGLPIDFPGTSFSAALKARDRIFVRLERLVSEHEKEPTADGLSRILAARPDDDASLGVRELCLELHHFVIAGLIIFAEFACLATELAKSEPLRARLRTEARAHAGPLTLDALLAMEETHRVVLEAKRFCPNVPVSFGRAKKSFELGGYTIPEGWFVFMAVGSNNMNAEVFEAPTVFDPDRFAPPRSEHEKHRHAYQPQGAGKDLQHRCAGVDFSTVFMKIFVAILASEIEWKVSDETGRLRTDVVPPEPKDGLRAVVKRR